MIDINFLRENPKLVKKGISAKQADASLVDEVLKTDKMRRDLIVQVEEIRAEKNKLGKDDVKKGRELKLKLKALEPELKKAEDKFEKLLRQIPNLPLENVPLGKGEEDNAFLKKTGEVPEFDFKPRDHLELGQNLDLIDVEAGAKVSGSRFAYLKKDFVLLEFGLVQYAFSKLLGRGFIPIIPPVLIKSEMMAGMGYLEHGCDQETYFLDKDGLYLTGTSEQALGPMHADEVLGLHDLPKRYLAYSPCFRREAGSYGKDTRGIFRVHQFNKLEMFSFCLPSKADKELKFLISLQEDLVKDLGLSYRLVKMCTGDLGPQAAEKFDIDCWFPGQEKYRETHSASNCTDYQARRLNIKYRKKDNSTEFIYTLNATYFADRLIIAILENYQQKNGSVKVPEVLQDFVGRDIILS
jgi:seryl-tRNA synthetase